MLFSYHIRRTYYIWLMMVSLVFLGLTHYGTGLKSEWTVYIPYYNLILHLVILLYGLIFFFSTAGMVINRARLWGDSNFVYFPYFIFWKKKLRWSDIVSLRFEKEGYWSNDRMERRLLMTIKSKQGKALRFDISNWNVYRDDIIYDFQKQNPNIKLRY